MPREPPTNNPPHPLQVWLACRGRVGGGQACWVFFCNLFFGSSTLLGCTLRRKLLLEFPSLLLNGAALRPRLGPQRHHRRALGLGKLCTNRGGVVHCVLLGEGRLVRGHVGDPHPAKVHKLSRNFAASAVQHAERLWVEGQVHGLPGLLLRDIFLRGHGLAVHVHELRPHTGLRLLPRRTLVVDLTLGLRRHLAEVSVFALLDLPPPTVPRRLEEPGLRRTVLLTAGEQPAELGLGVLGRTGRTRVRAAGGGGAASHDSPGGVSLLQQFALLEPEHVLRPVVELDYGILPVGTDALHGARLPAGESDLVVNLRLLRTPLLVGVTGVGLIHPAGPPPHTLRRRSGQSTAHGSVACRDLLLDPLVHRRLALLRSRIGHPLVVLFVPRAGELLTLQHVFDRTELALDVCVEVIVDLAKVFHSLRWLLAVAAVTDMRNERKVLHRRGELVVHRATGLDRELMVHHHRHGSIQSPLPCHLRY
eukprot:Hpha_TRINITY_DN16338_c2_g1::TRINITY_DN16338_c2_g1_i1::g.57707::m.57707